MIPTPEILPASNDVDGSNAIDHSCCPSSPAADE